MSEDKQEAFKLQFYSNQSCETTTDLTDDVARLLDNDEEHQRYFNEHGERYEPLAGGGYTVIQVLPEVWGIHFGNLVMAYVKSLNPTYLRITRGCVTTDARPGRVTIILDQDNVVKEISQEVNVGYTCGATLSSTLAAVKAGKTPPTTRSNVVINTTNLDRLDFS